MLTQAIAGATVLLLALGLYLAQACTVLIPYRRLLWATHGPALLWFAGTLYVNLVAALYVLGRRLRLSDTGRKLAHLDKQLRHGPSILDELTRRLED